MRAFRSAISASGSYRRSARCAAPSCGRLPASRARCRGCCRAARCNLPGCGKTTVGQLLAKKLDRIFVDTDDEISISDGKSAGDIIIGRGEAYFRELETRVCKELGKRNSLVIATGGGAVLKKENIRALKQNGKIVFIERPIHLLSTKGRPLSQKKKSLRELYENRISLYDKYSDISIKNDGLPEESVVKILEFLDLL